MKYSKLLAAGALTVLLSACTGSGNTAETLPLTNEEMPVEVVTEETTTAPTTPEAELTAYLETLLNTEPVTSEETTAAVPDKAKASFREVLDNEEVVYGVIFDDLNGDGTAEMIVGINPYGLIDIAGWENGELHTEQIDVVSDHGGTWDIRTDSTANTILNRTEYSKYLGAAGYEEWHIYTFSKDSNVPEATYTYLRDTYPELVPDDELKITTVTQRSTASR